MGDLLAAGREESAFVHTGKIHKKQKRNTEIIGSSKTVCLNSTKTKEVIWKDFSETFFIFLLKK